MINLFYLFLYYTGINKLFYFLTRGRQRVITFHNVIPEKFFDYSLNLGVSCTEDVLSYQIKSIKKRFTITTDVGIPNTCMLTFDDGYQNKYICSHKILKKESIKGVFFLNSRLIDSDDPLWIDTLLMCFSYLDDGEYIVIDQIYLLNKENRSSEFSRAYEFIFNNYHLKDKFIKNLSKYLKKEKLNKEFYSLRFTGLRKFQIDQMKAYGHLIASHTSNHDILSKLSRRELDQEISKCEKLMGNLFNCNYFSYPFGSDLETNQRTFNLMADSKFNFCFLNEWFFKNSKSNYQMQRFSLPNSKNKYLIDALLSGSYFFIKSILNPR